jgi:hypothetical protein
VAIQDDASTGNVVQGNLIGGNTGGTAALPGQSYGVLLLDGTVAGVGLSNTAITGNQIVGNSQVGVALDGAGVTDNAVQGNSIGGYGSTPLPNGGPGVLLSSGAHDNAVGGSGGNTIADNAGFGIDVDSGDHNGILGNALFGNVRGGIALDAANHANDDVAPPVLTGATTAGSITGTAAGPAGSYTVQFFASPSAAGAQGQVFIGSLAVSLPGDSPFTFAFTPAPGLDVFTATLTDANGNTSAFSNAVTGT